jgi:hypothetical protein
VLVIPFAIDARRYSVYVGFDDEGMERLKAYDPGELVLKQLGEPWISRELKDVLIGYCSPADFAKIQEIIAETNNPGEALLYLTRGWKYRPDAGDHDFGPISVKIDPNATKH